ncbi:MAG: sigma-70 family RNA polymerase sigma factor [Planctomycetota bacterium]
MATSDSYPDPESLLANLDWVRAIARGLVADSHLAEDLSQDVWLAALRRPPREGGSVRGWLAAVAQNLVRQRRRREGDRLDREGRAARAEGLPPTAELVERAAVQRALVDEVLALDELYREVVLRRYFEGLSPPEIARRLGVPLATVKTRLRRALALLRERLDARHCGDGHTWLAALAPLFPETGGSTAASVGVLLVGTKTALSLVAAIVGVVIGVVWWMQPEAAAPPERPMRRWRMRDPRSCRAQCGRPSAGRTHPPRSRFPPRSGPSGARTAPSP